MQGWAKEGVKTCEKSYEGMKGEEEKKKNNTNAESGRVGKGAVKKRGS